MLKEETQWIDIVLLEKEVVEFYMRYCNIQEKWYLVNESEI